MYKRQIYIDPPFFSKANYDASIRLDSKKTDHLPALKYLAYEDVWEQGLGSYLKMLCTRLYLIRDLLSDNGTVWVHLDWHAVHYVRILMDEIFGMDHFVNEIIWTYKSGGTSKKYFARKHDTILVYSKNKDYYFNILKEKSYNRGMRPYHFKGVKEYKDEVGWYTMVNMKDVWQIDMVGRTSSERNGYATQKPEALLERILACSTKQGDICADFFSGSGTLAAVAQRMGRRWIACDSEKLAIHCATKRLLQIKEKTPICLLKEKLDADDSGYELFVEVEEKEVAGSRTKALSIELKGYKAIDLGKNLDEEGQKVIRKVAEIDPLQLIEYWSVDFHYDGMVHRPDTVFSRQNGILTQSCQVLLKEAEKGAIISIKAADVLGNHVYRFIDRR